MSAYCGMQLRRYAVWYTADSSRLKRISSTIFGTYEASKVISSIVLRVQTGKAASSPSVWVGICKDVFWIVEGRFSNVARPFRVDAI